MNTDEYANEIKRLELDSSNNTTNDTTNSPSNSLLSKTTSKSYMVYFFIIIISFLFLILVKPRIILKINTLNEPPTIIIDKLKLILYWIGLSFVGIIGYMLYIKLYLRTRSK